MTPDPSAADAIEPTVFEYLARAIEEAKKLRDPIGTEQRSLALAITNLEQAALWLCEYRAQCHLGDPSTEALLRARSAVSHFAMTSGVDSNARCSRCGLPLNRWDEPCRYEQTEATMLAEDVLALAARLSQASEIAQKLTPTGDGGFIALTTEDYEFVCNGLAALAASSAGGKDA